MTKAAELVPLPNDEEKREFVVFSSSLFPSDAVSAGQFSPFGKEPRSEPFN